MSLLSLPPEIFNAVLDGVSGRDAMNLRLVCQRTSALSSHQFGLKCLTDLSFIWSPYSLQGLLDLSAHPLGRYIKRLTFSTHFIYAEEFTEDPVEQRNARLETTFDQWEERSVPLVRALENFREANVHPILGSYDYQVPWLPLDNSNNDINASNPPRKGYGFENYYGTTKLETRHATFMHTNQYILKAAQQAKFTVKAFHTNWNSQSLHQEDDIRFMQHQLLVSQPDGNIKPDFELLATFLDPEMCHCFGEIRIMLCDVGTEFLTAFLANQAKSLRVLHLEHITMDLWDEAMGEDQDLDNGAMALNFLTMLKNDLSLEYLKLSRLSNARDRSRLIGGHDDTWTSREEIQDGLQMYIQREEDDEHSVDEEWLDDDDEGEWISVHHSEDEDEEEVWPGILQDGNNETTTDRPDAGEGEESGV
ncbi:unnamed protein product [Aureobasidium uvarum]|uniref:F-box domain-containing protein n=1 Tax=Aureobasidium uvarum TaxID=2773716 RepID=A0A9N8KMS5_9PEZI|nr:unnamed protein product [Aureobasidium uvarum]